MPKVFISYRQINDEQRRRARELGQKLSDCGIKVILDQFYLDAHPAGPPEGWDKWSSDQALHTNNVIIVGTREWFECFEKIQSPGTGLGAACEADDLRLRIYEAGGINESIRVVIFDDADAVHVSAKLRRYHRFHAERDFTQIVRWLGGTVSAPPSTEPDCPSAAFSIPHNLPALQPFFGREEELGQIAVALEPESRTWGALIDGPGGMGKTSLAVRAALTVSPDIFERIVYVSLKSRELDDDGVRDLSGFLLSGLTELLGEVARELGRDDILKQSEEQRPRLLLDALRGKRVLIILDNLESLLKAERDIVFTFVNKLPAGCKAILTSRGRIGSGAAELILGKLGEKAALQTLDDLATHNPLLRETSEAERLELYHETGGAPLLLRWTAGQIGRGHCRTFADAMAFLRSCPPGNDPLEFVFGDLVEDFSEAETQALCALTYFTLPAKVEHIVEVVNPPPAEKEEKAAARAALYRALNKPVPVKGKEVVKGASFSKVEIDRALRSLANRSLVIPSTELETYMIVPLVADFLRSKKPEVIAEAGKRLEKRALDLIMENGHRHHDRFSVLEAAWPTVASALPIFLTGPNDRLQKACLALEIFLNFTGRWDERLALGQQAEARAVTAGDYKQAGWRAYQIAWVQRMREQADKMLVSANRAAAHWEKAFPPGTSSPLGVREHATALRLHGIVHELQKNYSEATAIYRKVLGLFRSLSAESSDVAIALSSLAHAERLSGNNDAAELHYHESLRVARAVNFSEGIAGFTSNMAGLAQSREDWPQAEALARESLDSSKKLGRQEAIAVDSQRLARALSKMGRGAEGLPHAINAVEIFARLGSPHLEVAEETLRECEGSPTA